MGKRLRLDRLAVRFALLLSATLLVTVGVYSAWSNVEQQRAGEQKVLEEARLLSKQMASSWEYVDAIQDGINYNSDGRYDFKGVYCSVAGKSIALRFTQRTDCIIRYTRENPRTGSDAPDAFETQALAAFANGEHEHYGVEEYEGEQVFRYASALEVEYGCLSCHGDPAGELDETGYPKEGMRQGDVAGAVSLIIPMAQYQDEAVSRTASNVLLFVVLAIVIVGVASMALHRWVTRPLSTLADAARTVGDGRFDACAGDVQASCEIADLVEEFSTMEARLGDFYGQLEAEVRMRTTELVEANALLTQEKEFQSTFLSTMSHELRTPIASVIAYVDVWLRSSDGASEDDRALMKEIRRNSALLLDTVNNTLDAASIEARRFAVDVVPVDLLDVANAAEAVVRPLADERSLSLEMRLDPALPLVETDPNIMHKILVNLLGNAVKFTDPGGAVTLDVDLDEGARTMVLTVSDTGIGIPADDLKLVFERFRQADSSISRTYGGSGLGLSLVQEMAELLGGSVSVVSEERRGSVFTVRVPYRPIPEA
ncbi:ATP-binding protein [Eggerthella sinensis]|uniref:ATP-binding protein n=1 Tax=Eggerthella sinensis TaxID=242230 RepID=UPI00266C0098|nr:ATP-binding protein [Eggerthella sinensis]